MAGISSLGVGSGVLTADVIDQLKEADESRIVKPLENKYALNNQKEEAYGLLSSLMTTFKASASALSYDTIFDTKTVDVSGSAEVSVSSGATVESFTLETLQLAKKDITQFGAVSNKVDSIASADGLLEIKIGADPLNPDKTLNINYTAGMSLSDLTQEITDKAGNDVSATILQTGDGAYSLVLTSKSTGENQALEITDLGGSLDASLFAAYDATTNPTGYQKIQNAQDSIFKYNGIEATRATNEIDDLILGVTMTLKKEGDFSDVNVAMDTENLLGEMQLLVDNFNALIQNINDMTEKNEETGAKGVFNDESFVKNIRRDITNVVTQLGSDGNSLVNFGLSLDRSGTMSFDKSVLEEKLIEDEDAVKLFFTGGTDDNGNEISGIFEKVDDKMKSYTGYGQMLSNFEAGIKKDTENILDSLTRARESLTSRYDIMTRRFTAYDGMISKINAQFSSLQMMISAEINAGG